MPPPKAGDNQEHPRIIPFSGRMIRPQDPSMIGDNFTLLENMRYKDQYVQAVKGMTKINTTAESSFPRTNSAYHFRKEQPSESHILMHAFDANEANGTVLENKSVIPAQGDHESTVLYTDASGSSRGRFSGAPGGHVAYCNGKEACIWGGDEARVARFINYDPDNSFSYDFTETINNIKSGSANAAVLSNSSAGGGDDANALLLLHGDGADESTTITDDGATGHTVTANGNAQLDTADKFFGTAAILFDGTGDYLSIPDHADFDLSGGTWTFDCRFKTTSLASEQTIYSHGTDASNFMEIIITTAGRLNINVTIAGSQDVHLYTQKDVVVNQWYHLACVEEGNIWTIYLNGIKAARFSDADRAADYTGTVKIGSNYDASSSFFSGWLDEIRLSNTARWSNTFDPPSLAYDAAANRTFAVLGSLRPLKGFKVYVDTANATASTMAVEYWDGTNWAAVTTLSDGTASGGASLAQSGDVTFDSTEAVAKIRAINQIVMYWYRITVSPGVDAATAIYYLTLDAPFQTIKDIWGGEYATVAAFRKWTGTYYEDYSVNVFEQSYNAENEATYGQLDGLKEFDNATPGHLIVGFAQRMTGLRMAMVGNKYNEAAYTFANVYYWDGSAWVSVDSLDDGTASDTDISLNKTGLLFWNAPDKGSEFTKIIGREAGAKTSKGKSKNAGTSSDVDLYYYKIDFTQELDNAADDIRVYYVAGIPAQDNPIGYKFPMESIERLWLCSEPQDRRNAARCSAFKAPQVFNGYDSVEFEFGDERELTGGGELVGIFDNNIEPITFFTKANETWILIGSDMSTAVPRRVSQSIGCVAPETIRIFDTPVEVAPGFGTHVASMQGADGDYLFNGRSFIRLDMDLDIFRTV